MTKLTFGTSNTYNKSDSNNDGYAQFEEAVKNRFESIAEKGYRLFKTDATNLYETFLNNLPQNARQHYACNACRSFYNKYGNLVAINENGETASVLWEETEVPPFFADAVKALRYKVMGSNVIAVFLSDSRVLGHPKTGEWTHVHAKLPSNMVYRSRLQTAGQAMAEKSQEYNMLANAMHTYTIETVDQALALIQSGTMYRSDRVLEIAKWFKSVIKHVSSVATARQRRNLIWSYVSCAPTGFTHIKSSMIGTLLEDIQSGMSADLVASRFAEKMNPANYQRSQSAPTANSILEAERLVQQLGIENSLQRRYATLEEIPDSISWTPKKDKVEDIFLKKQSSNGVFGHLTPKRNVDTGIKFDIPSAVMTWEKFNRTVLPTADSIEVKVDNPNRFMALVTAVDETSENILQWDNPFSWYYHGGVDAEMKRRIEEAGGQHEGNEIRVSLIWEGYTDLDLHCITPRGEHISYNNKRGYCGGYLDLDMNGLDRNSKTPVENMRWSSMAKQGRYKFYVDNYSEKVNGYKGTPFRVELEVNGQVYHYDGEALREGQKVTVFEFDYVRGQQPNIRGNSHSSSESWGVQKDSFVKVNAITPSPNLWGQNPVHHAGTHVFFLLDGVKDDSEGKGRGFFNEMLKPDLRQIRKTLESFTANTPIEDVEEATACGVGYSKENEWNLTLKVTTGNSSRIIKIDRWD